jgi:hypothetical protein
MQLNLVVQQHWTFPDFALAMRFSPVSPHVVTIHKNGFLRIYKSSDALSNEYVQALDISAKVYSLVDEGFNSFAFDPAYDGTTNKFGEYCSTKSRIAPQSSGLPHLHASILILYFATIPMITRVHHICSTASSSVCSSKWQACVAKHQCWS